MIEQKQILKHFVGIDSYRESKINEYKKVAARPEMYSKEYIAKAKKDAIEAIKRDRKERSAKALDEIERLREQVSVKKFKNPYAEIEELKNSGASSERIDQKSLLLEMQRNNQLALLRTELEVADSAGDFKELLERYGNDEHCNRLIKAEIKKRAKQDEKYRLYEVELNQPPKEVAELDKLRSAITFYGNNDFHPVGLDGAEDISGIKFDKLVD